MCDDGCVLVPTYFYMLQRERHFLDGPLFGGKMISHAQVRRSLRFSPSRRTSSAQDLMSVSSTHYRYVVGGISLY